MRGIGAPEGDTPVIGLTQQTQKLEATFSKLSSSRLTERLGENPAGLALSARLGAAIRSLDSSSQNIASGISLTRTTSAQLDEAGSLLTRMRELALQSSNETNSDEDRAANQSEFSSLREALDQLSASAAFNDRDLADDSYSSIGIDLGSESGEQLAIELHSFSSSDLGIEASEVSSSEAASASLEELDTALESVNGYRSELGSTENRLTSSLHSVTERKLSLVQTDTRISDADLAQEATLLAQQLLLQKGSASVLLQSNVAASRAQSLLGGFL